MKPANWGALAIAMLLAACRGGGSGTNVLPISAGNQRFAQQADFGSQVSHTKTVKLVEDKPLPIPAHGAFSGTFTEKSFSAPKGTTVTLESFTLKPSPAPTPVAPEGPGVQYQTKLLGSPRILRVRASKIASANCLARASRLQHFAQVLPTCSLRWNDARGDPAALLSDL